MKTRIMKKLRSKAGESIAEVMIAILVIAVASVLLAGMITGTNHMVTTSKIKMDEYYEANTALETFTVPEGSSHAVSSEGNVTISVEASDFTSFAIPAVSVEYVENTTFAGKPVIAYRMHAGS